MLYKIELSIRVCFALFAANVAATRPFIKEPTEGFEKGSPSPRGPKARPSTLLLYGWMRGAGEAARHIVTSGGM